MADDPMISFHIDHSQFDEMVDGTTKANVKATQYALRATGRYIQRAAKAKAPVYKGSDPTVEKGLLRKSIKNAKKIKQAGESYELKVGPWGTKQEGAAAKFQVHRHGSAGELSSRKAGSSSKGQVRGVPLYRNQMERMYGYMAAGTAAADAGAKEIFEAAYEKAWQKWMDK